MCTRQADASGPRPACAPFRTPYGDGVVSVGGGLLLGVDLPRTTEDLEARERTAAAGRPAAVSAEDRGALDRWVRELEEYFAGRRLAWAAGDIPLDALPVGEFARTVYATLLTVPPGETVSYGALAHMAGYPRAARAVGTAMATNPVPIVIPCHRVVRADGTLGNYGDDPAWKAYLLAHERDHTARSGGAHEQ